MICNKKSLNTVLSQLLFFLTVGLTNLQAQAQEFDRLYSDSIQASLSQPLQWVSADASTAPSLPAAFAANQQDSAFAPYTQSTVLPTSRGRDVWVRFSLAATPTPQSWIIRIPRVTVQKVSLYSTDASGQWQVKSAGAALASASWARKTRIPSFEVITGNQEKSYFLRFEHPVALTERPELMRVADFADGAAKVSTLIGLMFGMYGLLMIACFVAYAMARNSVFLALALFIASLLLLYLTQMGYGAWRIWSGSGYANGVMLWLAPLFCMAAGSWFFAKASYAKDTNKTVYRLLSGAAVGSLLLGVIKLVFKDALPPIFLYNWASAVLFAAVSSLLWLSWRGMRWNLWLVAGLAPIAGAAVARLAYNYGWLARVEFAQTVSIFLTQLGLMWLLVALVWRSRDALLSKERASALANNDPATGLIRDHVAKMRMERMLLRADRLKFGCGVIMLRWIDFAKIMASQSPERQDAMLKQFGQVLARVIRDIDTAAVLGDGHFMVLIEGPVSRSALASLSTQILTACIRLSEKFDQPQAFRLNVAIWQAEPTPRTVKQVIGALQTKLSHMSATTKRPVQFTDNVNSIPQPEDDQDYEERRDELIAKINAIEASPSLQAPLMAETRKRPAK